MACNFLFHKKIPWNFNNSRESFWQREKDSNPHKQSQSLSCYPYTIPLFGLALARTNVIIAKLWKLSRVIFTFLKFFISALYRPASEKIKRVVWS